METDYKLGNSIARLAYARVENSKLCEKGDKKAKQAETEQLEYLAQTYGVGMAILRNAVRDMAEALQGL